MNNNYTPPINEHILHEMMKLDKANDNIDILEDLYVSSPTNSIIIELYDWNNIKYEILHYLCHVSRPHRREYLNFEPDSIYMIF